ncbi:MAG TPA: YesL family protein [Wenzhouxiangella sp.]|nr:YesL family protein [Wenzhouxiangella sp.]
MTFMLANVVWFVLTVLIIPLPAATAGLFAVLAPWVRGRDVEFFSTFFGAMRRKWLKSTVIGLLDLVFAVMLVINFPILNFMGLPDLLLGLLRAFYATFALLVLLANIYVWPLLVLFDLPLRRLLSLSIRLAFVYPWRSLLTLALALLPLSLVLIAPLWLGVLGLVSGAVLIINWGTWRIIRQVATPEELAELNGP